MKGWLSWSFCFSGASFGLWCTSLGTTLPLCAVYFSSVNWSFWTFISRSYATNCPFAASWPLTTVAGTAPWCPPGSSFGPWAAKTRLPGAVVGKVLGLATFQSYHQIIWRPTERSPYRLELVPLPELGWLPELAFAAGKGRGLVQESFTSLVTPVSHHCFDSSESWNCLNMPHTRPRLAGRGFLVPPDWGLELFLGVKAFEPGIWPLLSRKWTNFLRGLVVLHFLHHFCCRSRPISRLLGLFGWYLQLEKLLFYPLSVQTSFSFN